MGAGEIIIAPCFKMCNLLFISKNKYSVRSLCLITDYIVNLCILKQIICSSYSLDKGYKEFRDGETRYRYDIVVLQELIRKMKDKNNEVKKQR